MTTLSLYQLYKYTWRTELFIHKYSNYIPFQTVNDEEIVLNYDPSIVEQINTKTLRINNLKTVSGSVIPFSSLKKTSEFGGKGSGHALRAENYQINRIREQIGNGISVLHKDKIHTIKGCRQCKPGVKADFTLFDENGDDVIFISHKDGTSPEHFQQWSGVSDYTYHPEVSAFYRNLWSITQYEMMPKTAYGRLIESEHLIKSSMFGRCYASEHSSEQNVDYIIQGNIDFIGEKDYNIIGYNVGFTKDSFIPNDYKPIIYASHRKNRKFIDIKNVRVSISPKNTRKNIVWI